MGWDKMVLDELCKDNFDNKFKIEITKNLKIALAAYSMFINEQEDKYLRGPKNLPLLGYLRAHAIQQQFYLSAFKPNARYSAIIKETDRFKIPILFLETNDFILNVGRTAKRGKLLSKANYKTELAKNNLSSNIQLELDFFSENNTIREEQKKYAVITYGHNSHKGLTHLDLLMPDSEYQGLIMPVLDLKVPEFIELSQNKEEYEPQIASLKTLLEETIKIGV